MTTGTAVATTTSGDRLAEAAQGRYTPTEVDAIRRSLVKVPEGWPAPSEEELALCIATALRRRLDPFAKQCYFVRFLKDGPLECYPSWKGLLKQAVDTGQYQGMAGPYFSADGVTWSEVWLEERPPAAAKASVYRKGHVVPTTATVTFQRCKRGYYKAGQGFVLTPRWKEDPDGMLGKAAKRLAIETAFPLETVGRVEAERLDAEVADLIDAGMDDEPWTDDQRKAIFAGLGRWDMDDEERHAWAGGVLDREVTTFTSFTRADAARLLDWLNETPLAEIVEDDDEPAPDPEESDRKLPKPEAPPTPDTPVTRLAAVWEKWHDRSPKSAEGWQRSFFDTVKQSSFLGCNDEEAERGIEWLQALGKAPV